MNEDVISHIRERVGRMRRVIELAHDPEMIALVSAMIEEAETDIAKLEAEPIPPPNQT